MPRLRDAPVAAPPPQPHQRLEERPDDQTPRKTVDTPRALRAALSCLGALVAVAVLWLVADHNHLLSLPGRAARGDRVGGRLRDRLNSRHFTDNRYLLFLGLARPSSPGWCCCTPSPTRGWGVRGRCQPGHPALDCPALRGASAYLGAALAIGRKPRPTHAAGLCPGGRPPARRSLPVAGVPRLLRGGCTSPRSRSSASTSSTSCWGRPCSPCCSSASSSARAFAVNSRPPWR